MQELDADSRASRLSEPDETVIERIRAGETQSYEIIMRRYNQRLFRIARSILPDDGAAQDAIQEAYISAFYNLGRFAPTGSFAAWLARIAVNEALMIKRKDRSYQQQRDTNSPEDHASDDRLTDQRTDPADVAANSELARLIETAVDQLPDEFRTVFILRAIQQLSVKETADSLDINEGTVKTRFHRARHLMQRALNLDIQAAGLHVFEFAGKRCDNMVKSVLKRLGA